MNDDDLAALKDLLDAQGADVPLLSDTQYARIIAPVMQAAAEVAAARNDPDLANDMAVMIGMRILVERFGEFYLVEHLDCPERERVAIARAPESACVLPLQRLGMEDAPLHDCLWALAEATRRLRWAEVIGMETTSAKEAWDCYACGDAAAGLKALKVALGGVVNKIDRWELLRNRAEAASNDAAGAADGSRS